MSRFSIGAGPEARHCRLGADVIESVLLRIKPYRHCYIAYSGGIDSHVLLHVCAAMPSLKGGLTAVHVHHGLQPEADVWPGHCRTVAERLDIEFIDLYVDARSGGRESPEEAARNARYAALKALLNDRDVLLVAQHREDQLETVLLQLFRGSGLQGLSGMPEIMPFGKGVLIRPFLNIGQQDIESYARLQGLNWVEDPSNQSCEYDRNFLRNQVVPLLKRRWPSVDKTVSRSAAHCAEAALLLDRFADDDFRRAFDSGHGTLSTGVLLGLDSAMQALVVRRWFGCLGLKMPSREFVRRVLDLIASGREEALLHNQGHTVRRHRERLYCLEARRDALPAEIPWSNKEEPLALPGDMLLRTSFDGAGIDPEVWKRASVVVRFRSGGEKIALPNRTGRHRLKNLYQEAGTPPWERASIPLVYLDGRLAAVADLWIDSEFYRENGQGCIRLLWSRKNKNRKGHDENATVD